MKRYLAISMSSDALPDSLLSMDRQYVWHPFTHMKQWIEDEQVMIERADGFELIDTQGNRYLDAFSSLWCNVHGHRVPQIDQAVRDQLDKVAHSTLLGLANEPAARLAELLVRIAPEGDGRAFAKVFYSDSGATATEIAFKIAVQYWSNQGQPSKHEFVAFEGAYHGDTTGAMSVGRMPQFNRPFEPMLFRTHVLPTCLSSTGCSGSCSSLSRLERVLNDRGKQIAGVVVEPMVQGAGGMLVQPACFVRGIRRLCDEYGVLMIADEVATGFGRTGKMFALEHAGVSSDLLCLGKGLTGGYMPLAATLATQNIFDAFLGEPHEGKTFFHGHTFTGNPLACAAAIASIQLMIANDVVGNASRVAAAIAPRVQRLADLSIVKQVRQLGLMIGIELHEPDPRARVAYHACKRMWKQGVMIRNLGPTVILIPPPAMPLRWVEKILQVIEGELSQLKAGVREVPDNLAGDAW
jgi:adenosylmethionine---8-amino-7-oxononanoate aminotransferase